MKPGPCSLASAGQPERAAEVHVAACLAVDDIEAVAVARSALASDVGHAVEPVEPVAATHPAE